MGNYSNNLWVNNSVSILYVNLAIALVILMGPAIVIGLGLWRQEFRPRRALLDLSETKAAQEARRAA